MYVLEKYTYLWYLSLRLLFFVSYDMTFLCTLQDWFDDVMIFIFIWVKDKWFPFWNKISFTQCKLIILLLSCVYCTHSFGMRLGWIVLHFIFECWKILRSNDRMTATKLIYDKWRMFFFNVQVISTSIIVRSLTFVF